MEYRDFDEDLRVGQNAEKLFLSKFKQVLYPVIQRVVSLEEQRRGKDITVFLKPVDFDVKVRDHKYYRGEDILLETIAVTEEDKKGWLYNTSIIVYLWWNKDKTKFVDGYILFLNRIRDWIKDKLEKYPSRMAYSKKGGCVWSTENKVVPISDFPIGLIWRINRDVFKDAEQKILSDFFIN